MAFEVNQSRIAKNTLVLFVRMGFVLIISFLTTRVTLQVLGVEDYGLNNLVSGVVSLFSFINASMGTAVQRFYCIQIGNSDDEKLKRTFGVGLYLHGIIAIITIILLEIFAIFFFSYLNIPSERYRIAQAVFQISSISLFLNILTIPYSALLRAREEFTKIAYIEIGQAILRLVVLYLLYVFPYDKLIVLSLLNFGVTVSYSIASIYFARFYPETHTFIIRDRELIKEMLNFVSLLLVTVLASLFRDNGIIILINMYFGLAINAAYAISMQVMSLANTFVANFKQSVIPQMMASYGAGDVHTMVKLINTGTKVTFLLMCMITVPLIFEMDYILNLWLTSPPAHANSLAKLALVNVNLSSFTYFLYQGVHATGKVVKQQISMSSLYVLNIILMWVSFELGAPFEYALYVTIFVSIFQCITNCYYANKTYNYDLKYFTFNILIRSIIVAILTIAAISVTVNILSPSFMRLILTCFISMTMIGLIGYCILLDVNEKNKVKVFIIKFLK